MCKRTAFRIEIVALLASSFLVAACQANNTPFSSDVPGSSETSSHEDNPFSYREFEIVGPSTLSIRDNGVSYEIGEYGEYLPEDDDFLVAYKDKLEWSSSDPSILFVNKSSGKVLPRKIGKTTVSVSVEGLDLSIPSFDVTIEEGNPSLYNMMSLGMNSTNYTMDNYQNGFRLGSTQFQPTYIYSTVYSSLGVSKDGRLVQFESQDGENVEFSNSNADYGFPDQALVTDNKSSYLYQNDLYSAFLSLKIFNLDVIPLSHDEGKPDTYTLPRGNKYTSAGAKALLNCYYFSLLLGYPNASIDNYGTPQITVGDNNDMTVVLLNSNGQPMGMSLHYHDFNSTSSNQNILTALNNHTPKNYDAPKPELKAEFKKLSLLSKGGRLITDHTHYAYGSLYQDFGFQVTYVNPDYIFVDFTNYRTRQADNTLSPLYTDQSDGGFVKRDDGLHAFHITTKDGAGYVGIGKDTDVNNIKIEIESKAIEGTDKDTDLLTYGGINKYAYLGEASFDDNVFVKEDGKQIISNTDRLGDLYGTMDKKNLENLFPKEDVGFDKWAFFLGFNYSLKDTKFEYKPDAVDIISIYTDGSSNYGSDFVVDSLGNGRMEEKFDKFLVEGLKA